MLRLVYTQNWFTLAMWHGYKLTQEPRYRTAFLHSLNFLSEVQDKGPEPETRGAWRGAFDALAWEWAAQTNSKAGRVASIAVGRMPQSTSRSSFTWMAILYCRQLFRANKRGRSKRCGRRSKQRSDTRNEPDEVTPSERFSQAAAEPLRCAAVKIDEASIENTEPGRRRRSGVRQLAAALIPRACSRRHSTREGAPTRDQQAGPSE